ncbi:MAG: hypothetical protein SV760_06105 [Halobacteria archaeon]|nr:hypothetical protein [Halobacteria archaeon]
MIVSAFGVPAMILLGGASAFAYKKVLRRRNEDWFVFLYEIFVVAFWIHAVLAATGALTFATVEASAAVGVFYVLSYPLWFKWGGEFVFILVGRAPDQGGALWVLRIKDTTEKFQRAWKRYD